MKMDNRKRDNKAKTSPIKIVGLFLLLFISTASIIGCFRIDRLSDSFIIRDIAQRAALPPEKVLHESLKAYLVKKNLYVREVGYTCQVRGKLNRRFRA